MDMDEVNTRIKCLRFMRDMGDELREKLADLFQSVSTPRAVPAGGVFIRENEHINDKGYILLDGALLIQKYGSPNVQCEAPQLIGEVMQFNPAGVRTATCAGAVPSLILRFTWDQFWSRATIVLTETELSNVKDALTAHAFENRAM
ncbi:MAG: hypothetical protein IT366_11530 [Candidatus Hydrogenedentes bacterium]|nr:hypothetical protein [Candidatus Hydrogenedentota bacterium]